jgi:sister chromatid cohesion protein DCC1
VTLSNFVLLASPSSHFDGSENQVVIQDTLNELLKLVPAVPKLHRMNVLLEEHEWEEGREEEDESFRAVSTRIGA